jgi:sugar lactone lactonase YvrE
MGKWTISISKPSDDPLAYVVADGGDAGNGANQAIGLLTALGPLSSAPPQVAVNEVTTIASVYSVAQFLDRLTATNVGSAVANTVGLPNAMANVANLAELSTGMALTTQDRFTPLVNPVTHASEAPPGQVLNSLAEVLAACIGSSGPTSMPCSELLGATTPSGGPVPANTRQAALTIALNPGSQVAALFQLSRQYAGLFAPDLGAIAPNDWTLAINFTGGAFSASAPFAIAIDAEGDAWVASETCDPALGNQPGCIIELTPQGAQSGPFPGAGQSIPLDLLADGGGAIAVGTNPGTGGEIVWLAANTGIYALDAGSGQFLFGGAMTLQGNLRRPQSLQVDLLGNVWVANSAARILTDGSSLASVFEVSPGPASDYSRFVEFDVASPVGAAPPTFIGMAIDGDDPANVFLSDALGQRVVELSGAQPGMQTNPPVFVSPGHAQPGPLAVDASGNVWVGNDSGGASELLKGVGVPGYVERDLAANTIYSPGKPGGIAMDGMGNAWVSNTDTGGNKGVVELAPSGKSITALTALGAYNGGSPPSGGPLGFLNVGTSPEGIAIDSSGNVWVATGNGGGVVELLGAATPVRTPLNTRAMLP